MKLLINLMVLLQHPPCPGDTTPGLPTMGEGWYVILLLTAVLVAVYYLNGKPMKQLWSEFSTTERVIVCAFGVGLVVLLVIQVFFPGVFSLNIR